MRNLSIRKRIMLLFSAAMMIAIFSTFFLVYLVSASVMKKTLSEYLVSAVDSNADKLVFLTEKETEKEKKLDMDDLFISYKDGVLRIDDDFLQVLNDVQCALYDEDGTLLYGESPLSRELEGKAFGASFLYEEQLQGERYVIYNRKLTDPELEGLWIRGSVPLSQQQIQLQQITKMVLAFLPLMVLLVIASSVLAAAGILQPIKKMEQTAAAIIDAQDLNERIEVGKNKDELHSLAENFNAMFDRLEASFARERQFTSDASHELRTPLAVILTQTEYILAKDRKKEDYESALSVIDRQANRMKRLVGDMLDLSRIGQGERRYPMERVDLSEITRMVCEDMSRISYEGITIEAKITEHVMLKGNADLLERLLVNLIDNAYKYGKKNGHTKVTLTQEPDQIHLAVTDDGIGISKEAMPKIFDRFYREEKSRSGSGYGLGLSLAAEIVSLHGGEIVVESEENRGSCFLITFLNGGRHEKNRETI